MPPSTTRAVFFDLDGTLFDRDLAVRSLSETQYVAFERKLTDVSRELFVSRLLELDAHGAGDKEMVYRRLILEFEQLSPQGLLRISGGAITISVDRFLMHSVPSRSFVLVARQLA